MTNKAVDHVEVSTPAGAAGVLSHDGRGYYFQYHPGVSAAAEISLTMPGRATQYQSGALFPLFEMNLPEGYVLAQLRHRLAKAVRFDPMLLLALTGQDAAIGRVSVTAPEPDHDTVDEGVSLAAVLAWDGAEDLFEELSRRYLERSGVSGVQPKLLVPESAASAVHGKGALTTRELIVKSAGDEYPGLASNEFLCMSMARAVGIPVAEFYLSDNHKLFVMRRFDRTENGGALGFEDMTVLMGRSSADKYLGSYVQIAKALRAFCAPQHVTKAQGQLFDQVALSCMVGNGDAHLKNFGVIYSDPMADDVRMAPAYDIVNTTSYLPDDGLALSLMGTRSLFVARVDIELFGHECGVSKPRERLREIIHACQTTLTAHAELLADLPDAGASLKRQLENFSRTYA